MTIYFHDYFKRPLKDEEELFDFFYEYLDDQIGDVSNFDRLKSQVSPEVFTACVSYIVVENWQGDGWTNIVDDYDLLPYISPSLAKVGYSRLAALFTTLLQDLPFDFSTISEEEYIEMLNFVWNARFKIKDERLQKISLEERKRFIKDFYHNILNLDQQAEKMWSPFSKNYEGAKRVIDFINRHL